MTGSAGPAVEAARDEGRAALVGYLPAGFPDVDSSIALIQAMIDGGCDVIEIGLPYSDPVMDGPTIQAAADVRSGRHAHPRRLPGRRGAAPPGSRPW